MIDPQAVGERHARYHADNIEKFLPTKTTERRAGVVAAVGVYCTQVLPGLIIDRRDPAVLATEDEDYMA